MKTGGAVTTALLLVSIAIVILTAFTSFYVGRISAVTTITEFEGIQIGYAQLIAGNETIKQNNRTSPQLIFNVENYGPNATLSKVQLISSVSSNFTGFSSAENVSFVADRLQPLVIVLNGTIQSVVAGQLYTYILLFYSPLYPNISSHTAEFVGTLDALNISRD